MEEAILIERVLEDLNGNLLWIGAIGTKRLIDRSATVERSVDASVEY